MHRFPAVSMYEPSEMSGSVLILRWWFQVFSATVFKQIELTGVKVDAGTALTKDFVLEVGLLTETIKVEGQTSLVETTSGSVGTTVQVSYVLDIPLADRNVFTLVNLVPGAFYKGSV